MRKRTPAFHPRCGLLFGPLLAAQLQSAAASDLTTGFASCAPGPVQEGVDEGDVACPNLRYGPFLPGPPGLAGAAAAGAGLEKRNRGGDLALVGAPPLPGQSSAAAPGRREDAAPRPRAEGPGEPLWGVISELRVGVLAHDVVFPSFRHVIAPNPFRRHFERGVNLNGEIAFVSPGFLHAIGSPRPRLGGSLNTDGYTSNAYVDLDWRYQFAAGPFFEGFLGVAVHDGRLRDANPEFVELGTRFLFHIGLEAGFRVYRRHGLSLFWEHMSNGALASKNQGMDTTGIRYGYRFGDHG